MTRGSSLSSALNPPLSLSNGGRLPVGASVSVLALAAALAWCYAPTLGTLWKDWTRDPNYSIGQLVPLAALYLAWNDRAELFAARRAPSGWGIALILAAQAIRYVGVALLLESVERYTIPITIAGLVLLLGGFELLRRSAWILAFLTLMIPLPGRIHNLISGPLQDAAASGAIALIELLGFRLERDGYSLTINGAASVVIAEGCSGLRMLTAFVVVACALAYLVERPRWQKAVLVLSSVPIAVGCNILRLTATVALCAFTSSRVAETFFHDFAGVSMMPLAVALLIAELWIMKQLVLPDDVPRTDATPNAVRDEAKR